MSNREENKPEFWTTATAASTGNRLPGPSPVDEPEPPHEVGPGVSIGAIILAVLALPSSLLIPPFAAVLAIVGLALSSWHLKRRNHRRKLPIVGIIVCAIALALAIGMTFYAYLSGPTPEQ